MYEDESEVRWQDFALCNGLWPPLFFEEYEQDPVLARTMDDICLSCPVRKQCLANGVEKKEWGLWGAIYLEAGKLDEDHNAHKTAEVWEQVKSL